MTTLNRKYAALPDLDSAPDVYETPELTDDNSTIPTTANRTLSNDGFDEEDEDEVQEGISRTRLRIDEARSRFLPANVDTNAVDFSDRVDGKRKSYKVSSRRQRVLGDGTYELGDLSDDDDDDESLERRIARLTREVEEAKEEYTKRKATAAKEGEENTHDEMLETLSQVLNDIAMPTGIGSSQDAAKFPPAGKTGEVPQGDGPTYTVTYAPSYEQTHALAKAADFDHRLVLLEKALGVGSSASPEAGSDGLPRAILPMLDNMDKQITTLSQASTANLDAISRRVRTLASEQDKLNDSREKTKMLREEMGKQGSPEADEPDQDAKINALYGILPTIESLTPMLPPLLDRLRSLRAIHADAATASQTLERIETQQSDMTDELKQWKEGLEKMETAMRDGDATVKTNVKVMEGWVKDLEARMAKLT